MITKVIRKVILVPIVSLLFTTCSGKVEKEFGNFCAKTIFSNERRLFSSDFDGSVKFQLEESMDKSSGRLIVGKLSQMAEGTRDLVPDTKADSGDCTECIFMFFRYENMKNRVYRMISGKISVEQIYFDTKERVVFATGKFQRIVFENESGSDCIVIEDMEFKFY